MVHIAIGPGIDLPGQTLSRDSRDLGMYPQRSIVSKVYLLNTDETAGVLEYGARPYHSVAPTSYFLSICLSFTVLHEDCEDQERLHHYIELWT